MQPLEQVTFDSIERFAKCENKTQIVQELSSIGTFFGYENFCIGELPPLGARGEDYLILSGWPESWLRHYLDHNLVHQDPVIRKVRQETLPFLWSEAQYASDDKAARRVMHDAKEFGLAEGLAVPIHGHGALQAVVTFGTSHLAGVDKRHKAALHLLGMYAHNAIISLREGRKRQSVKRLAPREIECLKWTAAGKSTWDISEILGLSERTVRQYIDSASRKLGAVNRPQAVAEALRHSLIS
ncbi:MAG: LuxR family transcriptional regulator, quorum-sensing system regulator BjaR1 [Methylobacteriaceae bacterium]|nr:LuxR family transcriptional regulator, quorum-sensing system regulator BjaR1 [Methylobacteriaceae bacterium]